MRWWLPSISERWIVFFEWDTVLFSDHCILFFVWVRAERFPDVPKLHWCVYLSTTPECLAMSTFAVRARRLNWIKLKLILLIMMGICFLYVRKKSKEDMLLYIQKLFFFWWMLIFFVHAWDIWEEESAIQVFDVSVFCCLSSQKGVCRSILLTDSFETLHISISKW